MRDAMIDVAFAVSVYPKLMNSRSIHCSNGVKRVALGPLVISPSEIGNIDFHNASRSPVDPYLSALLLLFENGAPY